MNQKIKTKDEKGATNHSTEGPLLIASCQSGTALAEDVIKAYQKENSESFSFLADIDFKFSDGETCVRLESDVNGKDVFVFQALQDPTSNRSVDENYMAFLLALRAFREWGANRVTGVLPYMAYARQDKPTTGMREPITAELMADLSIEAGLNRLVTWAPHDNRIHGFYGKAPVEHLSAIPMFMKVFPDLKSRQDVIGIAPDAGAAGFVIPFCRKMDIRCAITAKHRPEPEKASITDVMGDFTGITTAIILDDMISTGGTIEAVVTKLVKDKGITNVYVAISHFMGAQQAMDRLERLHQDFGLKRLVVTDSVPLTDSFLDLSFVEIKSLAEPLANAVKRIHLNQPLLQMDG